MSLGFKYDIKDGSTTVTHVDAGGPADRAGIKAEDKILEVDGLTTQGGKELISCKYESMITIC